MSSLGHSLEINKDWKITGEVDDPFIAVEIRIKPPVTVGDEFMSGVLGQDAASVRLTKISDDSDSTLFAVETNTPGSILDRLDTLNYAGSRILNLANNPTLVDEMSAESPFSLYVEAIDPVVG